MRNASLGLFALVSCAVAPSYIPERGSVYTDDAGVEVAIVDARSDTGDVTLIRITGTESKIDGKVLAHRREVREGRPLRFITQLRGDDYTTVWVEGYPRASGYHLVLPERRTEPIKVKRNPELSAALQLDTVVSLHRDQVKDGALDHLQKFNRPTETTAMKKKVDDRAGRYLGECDMSVPVEIAWDSFSDEELRDWSLDDKCTTVLWAMKGLCEFRVAREAFAVGVKKYVCRRGDEMAVSLTDGTLTWTASQQATNASRYAREFLRTEASWPGDGSLADRVQIERTAICTDGKGFYVGVQPQKEKGERLFFGDGKKMARVRPSPWGIGGDWFFEPREYNPKNNSNFRGTDLRFYSHVNVDADEGTCELWCGARAIPLDPLDYEAVRKMLDSAELVDPPPIRRAYALARNRKGTYYFVDTGEEPDSKKFRLYAGPKGALKEHEMVNIVSDSNGDIFSTKSGSLRLVLEKEESFWVRDGKSEQLLNVPLHENWGVIYNELGIYTGQPLGTPCDDL